MLSGLFVMFSNLIDRMYATKFVVCLHIMFCMKHKQKKWIENRMTPY